MIENLKCNIKVQMPDIDAPSTPEKCLQKVIDDKIGCNYIGIDNKAGSGNSCYCCSDTNW